MATIPAPSPPEVSVSVQNQLPPGPSLFTQTVSGITNDYIEWSAHVQYLTHSGKVQIPVAGPDGTPCQIVKQHAATSRLMIQATVRRTGVPPVVPDPNITDVNAVLLFWDWLPSVPRITPAGSFEFAIACVYDYALLLPVNRATGFRIPFAPFYNFPLNIGIGPNQFASVFPPQSGTFNSSTNLPNQSPSQNLLATAFIQLPGT